MEYQKTIGTRKATRSNMGKQQGGVGLTGIGLSGTGLTAAEARVREKRRKMGYASGLNLQLKEYEVYEDIASIRKVRFVIAQHMRSCMTSP
jgi:hypothetical protein